MRIRSASTGLVLLVATASPVLLGSARVAAASAMWGVDSASTISAQLSSTQSHYGRPTFWGRYITSNQCDGSAMSSSEAATAATDQIPILVIDNTATCHNGAKPETTYANGVTAANSAITGAHSLGIPTGVAIYEDIETNDPITTSFIEGYEHQIAAGGYLSGFYENSLSGPFHAAYCNAVAANAIYAHTLLWASEPQNSPNRTGPGSMPAWAPARPPCQSTTVAWQYGTPSEGGPNPPNVDTDEVMAGAGLWSAVTNGSFIQVAGAGPVFEVVGGAPVYVSSWANVGGGKPVTKVSATQFASLRQYPANGTAVFDDGTTSSHGTGYVFAGGAPLTVANWANVGSPSYIGVDPYSLSHYAPTGPLSHVRQYPLNGTAVFVDNPGTGHGAGYEFAGGAPLPVAKWSNIGSPAITGVDSFALSHYAATGPQSHVRQYPLDGTAVYDDDPGPGHGAGFEFAGGAPLPVADWSNIGSPPITGVDDYALTHPAAPGGGGHVLQHPVDNTYLRGGQTGQVFRVLGGVASYLKSWKHVGGPKPTVTVDQVAIDNAGTGGSWDALISGTPHLHLAGPARRTRHRIVHAHWSAPPQSAAITNFDVRERAWRTHRPRHWNRPASLQATTTSSIHHRLGHHQHWCISVRGHNSAGITGPWTTTCTLRR